MEYIEVTKITFKEFQSIIDFNLNKVEECIWRMMKEDLRIKVG